MPDTTARPIDDAPAGRVLDAQASFGRREDGRLFHGMIGRSAAMQALFRAVGRLAPLTRATLITGETGAGKATLAAVAHRIGPCRGGAQVTLLRGDDVAERTCLAEAGRGSRVPVTCFVPELGDLPAERQAELVRALTAAADLPLGEGLHVIAATSADVTEQMASGRLRSDLYYRLSVARFHMPPLSARRDDIAELAGALLRDACRTLRLTEKTWSSAALRLLEERRWPGNVRELRNVVLRAAALSDEAVIGGHAVGEAEGLDLDRCDGPRASAGAPAVLDVERRRVRAALASKGGNKSAAAAALGVSRRAFYRLLERTGA